ncbi:MAG TPA: hypothetical protein VJ816_11385 [Gemmatimonadales bacterium]|nr:hypothetical protein [Gemmatimonadales bacterium]
MVTPARCACGWWYFRDGAGGVIRDHTCRQPFVADPVPTEPLCPCAACDGVRAAVAPTVERLAQERAAQERHEAE